MTGGVGIFSGDTTHGTNTGFNSGSEKLGLNFFGLSRGFILGSASHFFSCSAHAKIFLKHKLNQKHLTTTKFLQFLHGKVRLPQISS
jgi:hypothetical protein